MSESEFPTFIALLVAEGIPVSKFIDGDISPPRRDEEQVLKIGKEELRVPATVVHQWQSLPGGRFRRTVWRFYAESDKRRGDRTVPDWSLKGFGGPAFLFNAIPEGEKKVNPPRGPEHTDAPNEKYVWDRIMRTLQGALTKNDGELDSKDTL